MTRETHLRPPPRADGFNVNVSKLRSHVPQVFYEPRMAGSFLFIAITVSHREVEQLAHGFHGAQCRRETKAVGLCVADFLKQVILGGEAHRPLWG